MPDASPKQDISLNSIFPTMFICIRCFTFVKCYLLLNITVYRIQYLASLVASCVLFGLRQIEILYCRCTFVKETFKALMIILRGCAGGTRFLFLCRYSCRGIVVESLSTHVAVHNQILYFDVILRCDSNLHRTYKLHGIDLILETQMNITICGSNCS